VHVLFTHAWLLTVRAAAGNAMDRVHRVYGTFREEIASNPALGLLIVLDDFIASFHPILDQAEQALYELEDESSCRHCIGSGSPSARQWRPSPSRSGECPA
jgi:Mg2+ and Co2+ transporter CorA